MRILLVALVGLMLGPVENVLAQVVNERGAVERLFLEEPAERGWFADSFATAVPVERVSEIVRQLLRDFGAYEDVRVQNGEGAVRLARARVPVTIRLDGDGRIAGLVFGAPVGIGTGVADLAETISEAAGSAQVALLVTVDGADIVAREAERAMAVASAFKLLVLRAYEDAVAAGDVRREDIVRLRDADRSLPSGVLQTLAEGTPLTLESLAGLMIRQSDNTATDALMRAIGRERVEALLERDRPLPTTGELFKLVGGPEERLAGYAVAGMAARREMLAALANEPLPDASAVLRRATWDRVEWYLSARELCALLRGLRGVPALDAPVDLLLADERWEWLGFKGGSGVGVLNLSVAATHRDGREVCAVMSVNGPQALPEDRLLLLFGALAGRLAEGNPQP